MPVNIFGNIVENHTQENKEQQGHFRKRNFSKYFFFWVFIFILCIGAYYGGYDRGKAQALGNTSSVFSDTILKNTDSEGNDVDFSLFWKAWNTLEEKYVDADELDAQKMMYGAIEGMLRSSGDPYTTFFDPEENKSFDEDISGEFEGIGAEMEMKDELITIVAPLVDSPASKAGLRAGDIIVSVDGEEIIGETLMEVVSKIRGHKGTKVILSVAREGAGEMIDIPITRATIEVKSVEFEMKDQVALISIRRFGDDTLEEFQKGVARLREMNATSLIIDVRDNPGGYLSTATNMGNMLLKDKSVVVIEEDSKGEREEIMTKKTAYTDSLVAMPTVVLINKGSASASEILAGALQYHRENVTIVGTTSFGKGSVQELIPLPQKTAVKVTVAKWLIPSGEQINEKGINPDVTVEMTEEDYKEDRDPQMEKALEILREEE